MPTVTVKFNDQEFARLEQTARERQMPKSEILREAFEKGVVGETAPSLFETMGDLIGSIRGPGDLSTSKKYMEDFGEVRSSRKERRKKVR